ncbi:uncharacterized protein [Anabrus simplex]|uniref:uncharacterized protein isoform X2 n=1 Tax=Anabrus simplex TaxID=316456 RepID=UPI0035A3487E
MWAGGRPLQPVTASTVRTLLPATPRPLLQVETSSPYRIDFHQLATPGNLANSAVLRMLEEEERQRGGEAKDDDKPRRKLQRFAWPPKRHDGMDDEFRYKRLYFSTFPMPANPGLKRVTWPPPPEFGASEEQAVYSKGPAFGDSIVQQTQTWSPQSTPQQQPDYQSPPPSQPVYEPPTTVILRSEAPVSQEPPPIYTSQPAAIKVERPRMRGDEKWPPVEYKTRAAAENDARVALARGPTFRPRKVKRDYTSFFAQNALTPNYPSYRAPPGTQHYVEEGTSNF